MSTGTYSYYTVPGNPKGVGSLKLTSDQAIPEPGKGEVLMKIHAVALNYRDVALVNGNYPSIPDVVPCSDGAGEVISVGEGVTKWKKGDRVIGQFTQTFINGHYDEEEYGKSALGGGCHGMLTEYKILADYGLVRIPEYMSYEEASTLPCAGLTAWNALYGEFGNVQCLPGHTVVLQGTGGVSCFGAQFAVSQGARAIITSSSDEKLDKIRNHINGSRNHGGSGELITHNYKEKPDWDEAVMKYTREGAEHILEVGGAGTVEKSFKAIRKGGVITTIGFIGTKPGDTPPNVSMLALSNGAIFRGILIGNRRQLETMCDALSISKIKPMIGATFEFKDAAKAYEALESQGVVGKVVIRVP